MIDKEADREETRRLAEPGVREVIAYAWFCIGYPPAESLVLVPASGRGPVLRLDLPPVEWQEKAAAAVTAALLRADVDEVVGVLVHEVTGDTPLRPRPDDLTLTERVTRDLRRAGIALVDVLVTASGHARSLLCSEPRCCPPAGRPLGDLRTTRTAAAMVLAGRALAAGETALVADVDPEPPSSQGRPGLSPVPWPSPSPLTALQQWRRLLATTIHGHQERPGHEQLQLLAHMVTDVRFRDAVLVTAIGADEQADAVAAGTAGLAPDTFSTAAPDRALLEAARMLLAAVARRAEPAARCEALAMLAWLAWWSGDAPARSRQLARLALDIQPRHRLARLTDRLLSLGAPPPWHPLD